MKTGDDVIFVVFVTGNINTHSLHIHGVINFVVFVLCISLFALSVVLDAIASVFTLHRADPSFILFYFFMICLVQRSHKNINFKAFLILFQGPNGP